MPVRARRRRAVSSTWSGVAKCASTESISQANPQLLDEDVDDGDEPAAVVEDACVEPRRRQVGLGEPPLPSVNSAADRTPSATARSTSSGRGAALAAPGVEFLAQVLDEQHPALDRFGEQARDLLGVLQPAHGVEHGTGERGDRQPVPQHRTRHPLGALHHDVPDAPHLPGLRDRGCGPGSAPGRAAVRGDGTAESPGQHGVGATVQKGRDHELARRSARRCAGRRCPGRAAATGRRRDTAGRPCSREHRAPRARAPRSLRGRSPPAACRARRPRFLVARRHGRPILVAGEPRRPTLWTSSTDGDSALRSRPVLASDEAAFLAWSASEDAGLALAGAPPPAPHPRHDRETRGGGRPALVVTKKHFGNGRLVS